MANTAVEAVEAVAVAEVVVVVVVEAMVVVAAIMQQMGMIHAKPQHLSESRKQKNNERPGSPTAPGSGSWESKTPTPLPCAVFGKVHLVY